MSHIYRVACLGLAAMLCGCHTLKEAVQTAPPTVADTVKYAEARDKAYGYVQQAIVDDKNKPDPEKLKAQRLAYVDAQAAINSYLEAVAEREERGVPFNQLSEDDKNLLGKKTTDADTKATKFYKLVEGGSGNLTAVEIFGDLWDILQKVIDAASTNITNKRNQYACETRSSQWLAWDGAAQWTGADDKRGECAKADTGTNPPGKDEQKKDAGGASDQKKPSSDQTNKDNHKQEGTQKSLN